MSDLEIVIVPYYDDNFAYLVHEKTTAQTALIDCGEIEPVLRELQIKGWKLDYILATHFHYDHAGEIEAMQKEFPNVIVIKPAGENRLTMSAKELAEGEKMPFGSSEITAVSLRAHTMFCTGYAIEGNLFVGDALFSAGCGRLFEGTPADLERAMDRISAFPEDTNIYFGHEYTQSNIRFAKSIEPNNKELDDYRQSVDQEIGSGRFSTPTTVKLEKLINPFLRIDQPEVIQSVDAENKLKRTERIGALRSMKDSF